VAALFAAVAGQQNVAGDPVDPCPGILVAARQFIETAPYNEESVSDYVFSLVRVSPALNKPDQVRVDPFVNPSKGVFPVGRVRKVPHALYLSPTQPSVSHKREKVFLETPLAIFTPCNAVADEKNVLG
jgi:hypothetical protein